MCASQYGTNTDNPDNPIVLTQQQKDRAIDLTFEEAQTIYLRFSIQCCSYSGGRNFLFAGD